MANIDHQTIALAFANALFYCLKDTEGIVVRGEDSDHIIHKFIVYRKDSDRMVHVSLADNLDKPIGTRFWIHETVEDTMLAAALNGGEFIIDEN